MSVILIILDGWGLSEKSQRNAIKAGSTPVFDSLWNSNPTAELRASGDAVGLPHGQFGNSEVGHLTIGAGSVTPQTQVRINRAIQRNKLSEKVSLQSTIDESNEYLHLIGLVSDAGVHSHLNHAKQIAQISNDQGVKPVVHAITDGRDTLQWKSREYLTEMKSILEATGGCFSTVVGRYFAMDRNENWQRTRAAVRSMCGENNRSVETAEIAVEQAYGRGENDEHIAPTNISASPNITEDTSVVCFNFRNDRMRQLAEQLSEISGLELGTMTEYTSTVDTNVLFEPEYPSVTLAEVLAKKNLSQLRISESEKEAHVTRFFNGGRSQPVTGEQRAIVESPTVATYNQVPSMNVKEVTNTIAESVNPLCYDFILVNYPNPDMVGHTGDFEATMKAIESVDASLGRITKQVEDSTSVIVTADHGNAEEMGSQEEPRTSHTKNPVPFILCTQQEQSITDNGQLSDIAPTVLELLEIKQPQKMTGSSLIEKTTAGLDD